MSVQLQKNMHTHIYIYTNCDKKLNFANFMHFFFYLFQTNPDSHKKEKKKKNMCLWYLDTLNGKRKKSNSSVYCNVTLLRNSQNYAIKNHAN